MVLISDYRVIGKNVARVDAVSKVNGTAVYCDDVYLRNMVYGRLVHSPYAHARIVKIDTGKAMALPGVRAVLLAEDIPENRNLGEEHGWIFAEKEVCYIGDPVALVVADSVCRLCPGVLSSPEGYEEESHYSGLLEYPQYSRPEEWNGRRVPEILLSGHHANIAKWRHEQALERTRTRRPDLYEKYEEKSMAKIDK